MAKGESGVDTAKRYKDLLKDYIDKTPIEQVPIYRDGVCRSEIAEKLGFDRKRLNSSHCAPFLKELDDKLSEHLKEKKQECAEKKSKGEITGANIKSEGQKRLERAERAVEKYKSDLKKAEKKINKLMERISVLTIELHNERTTNRGVSRHYLNSIRTIHAK